MARPRPALRRSQLSPRRRGRLFTGTSGYVYADWRGRFYPRDLPAHAWLAYYPQGTAGPPGTAPASRKTPGSHAGARVVPVSRRFHLDLERLDGFLDALARHRLVRPLRAVLEERHPSWLAPAVFEGLGRANVALCPADWQGAPVSDGVTADFIYIRRHGLRRYAGRYSDEALAADALRIGSWLEEGRDVYVYFNNNARAHAVGNARGLIQLVQRPDRPRDCNVGRSSPRPAARHLHMTWT